MRKHVPKMSGIVSAVSVLLAVAVGVLLGLALAVAIIARLWRTALSEVPI